MKRGIVAFAVVAFVGLLAPAAPAIEIPPAQQETTTSQLRGVVRRVIVNSNGGDVVIRAGNRASVRRTEHWVYERPHVQIRFENSVLTITTRCSHTPLNNCWVDVAAAVASNAQVLVEGSLGSVHVDGITGRIVKVETSNGPLRFSRLGVEELSARTSNGDIRADLTSAPTTTTLRTSNGDIDAVVPRGRYVLDLDVSNGDVRTRGVSHRRNSQNRLSARTSNGDITITGR